MGGPNDAKLVLTRGIPASGKSTWAKRWVAEDPEWRVRINRDDLRLMTFGQVAGLGRMREETLTTIQAGMVTAALRAKQSVVVDDTNLTARFVKEWMRLALREGVDVEFKDFDISLELALERNLRRSRQGGIYVPDDVIRSFHQRFVRKDGKLVDPPVLEDDVEESWLKYEPDESLPTAFLVDIDGTLARMIDRGPFEWHRVGEDEPIQAVIDVVLSLQEAGHRIVFMSGRDEACREETSAWLTRHVYNDHPERGPHLVHELYMRPARDMRKDSIVKHELFWDNVADKYNVVGVIDDRNQVVKMWRAMGLTVFQCADGDF